MTTTPTEIQIAATRSTITGEVMATIVRMLKLRTKNATYSTAETTKIAFACVDSNVTAGVDSSAGVFSILRRTMTKRRKRTK